MAEKPILFTAPMVRAILGGTKTQTRRVVKQQNGGKIIAPGGPGIALEEMAEDRITTCLCPHGQPGDQLWVREPWRVGEDVGEGWFPGAMDGDLHLIYDTDRERDYRSFPTGYRWPRNVKETHNSEGTPEHWISYGPIPSIFMPRWASRILLEVTAVRVERLQDISEADAVSEGIEGCLGDYLAPGMSPDEGFAYADGRGAFRHLWESINGPASWAANPWVWVIEFKRVEQSHG